MPAGASGTGPATRPTVGLIVPTRNEASHVPQFIERVEAALAPFPIDWHAEVIDDSDDDTIAVLRRLARKGAPLEVSHRQDAIRGGGIGGAVRWGLTRAHGEIICVIDADLQHPPEILPELLAPIALGRADISVGSRYRWGGSAAGFESRWRRVAARLSGALLRRLYPATRLTTDPGSGLFAVRREVLDSLALRPRGSRVLAEILVRGRWRALCDVPYSFEHSRDGETHIGAAATVSLARELISLLRLDHRLAGSGDARISQRDVNRPQDRRRVAPVQPELLRGLEAFDDVPYDPVGSGPLV